MFVNHFSALAPSCNHVMKAYVCILTVCNDDSDSSIAEHTTGSMIEDTCIIESSNICIADSESTWQKSLTWLDFVVCVQSGGSTEYEKICLDLCTAEGSISVSES